MTGPTSEHDQNADDSIYPIEQLRMELSDETAVENDEELEAWAWSLRLDRHLESELLPAFVSAEIDYLLAPAPRVTESFKKSVDRGARRGLESLSGLLSDRSALVKKLQQYRLPGEAPNAIRFGEFVDRLGARPVLFTEYQDDEYTSWIVDLGVSAPLLLSSVHPRHAGVVADADMDEPVLVMASRDAWAAFRDRVERAVRMRQLQPSPRDQSGEGV